MAHEPLSGFELGHRFVVDVHKWCPDDGKYQSIKQLEHFSTEEVFLFCFFRSIRIPGGHLIYTLLND